MTTDGTSNKMQDRKNFPMREDLDGDSCSDTVTTKSLAEVSDYARKRIPASDMGEAGYVGVETLLRDMRGRGDVSFDCSEQKVIEFLPGDILIGNIRPYLRKIWFADNAGGTNGDVLTIRVNDEWKERLLPRYLYHCLASDRFFHFMMSHVKGSKMPRGNKEAIMRYRFPVPPIEEQEETITILDMMEELEERLEEELGARRRQRKWWQERLLDSCESD
jgi:type I restriction enzyme S subunit